DTRPKTPTRHRETFQSSGNATSSSPSRPALQSCWPGTSDSRLPERVLAIEVEGTDIGPSVDGDGEQVALLVDRALADLTPTHGLIERPRREIGCQDADPYLGEPRLGGP